MLNRSLSSGWCGLATLMVCAGACVSAACASRGESAEANSKSTTAAGAAVPVVEADRTPGPSISALGYRIEWRGYPQVSVNGRVRFFDTLGDTLLVHDDRNIVTAMEPSNGANRWALDLGSDLTKYVGNVRIGDRLLCCAEGEIQFLDVKTGGLDDRQRLAALANTSPAMIGSMAIFGCATGEVLGHNTTSGYKQWGYDLHGRIIAKPAAADSSVAAVSEGGEVVVLNAASGVSEGRRARIFDGLDNDPVVGENMLFVAGRDQSIWAVRLDDGRIAWRHRGQYPMKDQPTFHDGRLYQAIPNSGLVAFNAGDGSILWTAAKVQGSVIGVRGGRLVVWDGNELMLLDSDRGDVIDRVAMPGIDRVVTDQFIDGNMYTVAERGGRVEKFSPRG